MGRESGTVVTSDQADGVMVVEIRNAARANCLSVDVIGGLWDALRAADRRRTRVIILKSEGDGPFSAGADLESLKHDALELREADLFGMFEYLERLDSIIIASVQGPAIGGGFELALCADLVVAAERARFSLPETRLGLAPGIAMIRLHRFVPPHVAKLIALGIWTLTAEDAERVGIVNRVVRDDMLEEDTNNLVREVLKSAPLAAGLVKQSINRQLGGEDWRFVREGMSRLFTSDDLRAGLDAWKRRTNPDFEGR